MQTMGKTVSQTDFRAALPDVTSSYHCATLGGEAVILRDPYGIPHVRADTVHGAFFCQGFATAQDRLWHMDYDRKRACGRLAEYCGESSLSDDILMRRLQILRSAQADYQKLNAETRAMFDAYSEGVNAFIRITDRLPIEYALLDLQVEPWSPWDCIAVYKVRHILMGSYQEKL